MALCEEECLACAEAPIIAAWAKRDPIIAAAKKIVDDYTPEGDHDAFYDKPIYWSSVAECEEVGLPQEFIDAAMVLQDCVRRGVPA